MHITAFFQLKASGVKSSSSSLPVRFHLRASAHHAVSTTTISTHRRKLSATPTKLAASLTSSWLSPFSSDNARSPGFHAIMLPSTHVLFFTQRANHRHYQRPSAMPVIRFRSIKQADGAGRHHIRQNCAIDSARALLRAKPERDARTPSHNKQKRQLTRRSYRYRSPSHVWRSSRIDIPRHARPYVVFHKSSRKSINSHNHKPSRDRRSPSRSSCQPQPRSAPSFLPSPSCVLFSTYIC
jgi:hypothetical protein